MGFPSALIRGMISWTDFRCTVIALTKTISAQMMSLSLRGATFMSTSRFSVVHGSMAAMVSKPSGGEEDFFLMNFSACLKLQKVSGNSG